MNNEVMATREIAPSFMIELARMLRVASMHRLNNASMAKVCDEFEQAAGQHFQLVEQLSLSQVGDHLYFNGEFVPMIGRAYEAALHMRRLFKRLGVSELSISDRFERGELHNFLEAFQETLWRNEKLGKGLTVPKFSLRAVEAYKREEIESRELVSRAYVHMATLIHEARRIFEKGGKVSVPVLRRGVYLLTDAVLGQEDLLLALTRAPNSDGQVVLHSASVAAFSLMMGLRIGLDRPALAGLVLSAIFHEIGREEAHHEGHGKVTRDAVIEAQQRNAWLTAIGIGHYMVSAEAVERAAIALECTLPVRGGQEGIIPSMTARLINVACTFDSLVQPAPPWTGLRPDQAIGVLTSKAESRIDAGAVALFTSVVGVYPVGTLVQLSGGQIAVVLATPERPERPTVKVIRDKGLPADYVLELARDDVNLDIVQCLEPEGEELDVLHLLLA
jgi:HD-GYP domain-containing protein (c-di-GMP phosphodiesterase class II)